MQYLITFLEGIISFISPCMLPMLPLYISYFAGESGNENRTRKVAVRAAGFMAGFTVVFCLLGVFAGTIGSLLVRYQKFVNIICGGLIIIFGLSYLDVFQIRLFKGVRGRHEAASFVSAFLFGMVYAAELTPCVGAFLGSALLLAASAGGAFRGLLLLLVYSLGLGIPFVLSAILIGRLTGTFSWIKKHYRVINLVCGLFLIVVGAAMAAGLLGRLMAVFS